MGKTSAAQWKSDDTKSKVWKLVHAAGAHGTKKAALMDALGLSATALAWHLEKMMRDHYVLRSGRGQYCPGVRVPPIEGLALEQVLALIDDCPQGVSMVLLCQELQLGAAALFALLEPAEKAGTVERIAMPARHGGVGWCLPGMQAAGEEPPHRLDAHDLAHPDVAMLPVVEVDIDRIHRVQRGDNFAARLADGKLHITSGALSFTLSEAYTAKLLQYLLAEVCK